MSIPGLKRNICDDGEPPREMTGPGGYDGLTDTTARVDIPAEFVFIPDFPGKQSKPSAQVKLGTLAHLNLRLEE